MDFFATLCNTIAHAFASAIPYSITVPSYGCSWGFCIGTPTKEALDYAKCKTIDHGINTRKIHPLKCYDQTTHHHIFTLPKYLREALRGCDQVFRDQDIADQIASI